MRPVYVYDPAAGRKVYVGSRRTLRGDDGAQALERAKTIEFARRDPTETGTISEYAAGWLTDHHGPGTKRPASGTLKINEQNLRPLLEEFGARPLEGGITRRDQRRGMQSEPVRAPRPGNQPGTQTRSPLDGG
jgi:hypothetical protein